MRRSTRDRIEALKEHHVESWQLILGGFFILLPIVLMVDYWGDERLTFRGKPIQRDWRRQIEHETHHDEH